MRNHCQGDVWLLIVAAVSAAVCAAERHGLQVIPQADRPGNPDVNIHTGRQETTYNGRLDPFNNLPLVLNAFNVKFELDTGQTQCFYSVLLVGYHYIQDAQTVRFFQESNFDIFVSNGYGQLIVSDFQVSAFRNDAVINVTDSYETCVVNRGQRKMISFSAYRVIPNEQLGDHNNAFAKIENFSDTATASIGQLEIRMASVLSFVRGHSEVYRDTATLRAANSSIQWKAWAILSLQLVSLAFTTYFIRHLFNAPVGKFSATT